MIRIKNIVSKPIINMVLFLLLLVILYFLGNVSQLLSKEYSENEIGYIVIQKGTVYFIQGKDVQQSDLESFSSKNFMYSNQFESVSILNRIETFYEGY